MDKNEMPCPYMYECVDPRKACPCWEMRPAVYLAMLDRMDELLPAEREFANERGMDPSELSPWTTWSLAMLIVMDEEG
jgi:hypothetical protein